MPAACFSSLWKTRGVRNWYANGLSFQASWAGRRNEETRLRAIETHRCGWEPDELESRRNEETRLRAIETPDHAERNPGMRWE
jgi:hypothetical protein